MKRINEMYCYETTPKCNEKAVVKGEKYRFTVLTHGLIRMEYNENGVFEDRATKGIVNRNFPVPEFTVEETDDKLIISTETLILSYLKDYPFSPDSLTARYCGEIGDFSEIWTFKDYKRKYYPNPAPQTRKGTRGSLDGADGEMELEEGIISANFADYDDSKSMIIAENGWVEERPDGIEDTYLFAYGNENNIECLHDFLELSGKIPMVPRYVLGNWWTRYYAYTEEEYKAVLSRFEDENIPITVAVLDMDWHLTEIEKDYGTGWTGYSWNKELFPNPKKFMDYLHSKGYAVALNLHDREGISPHEDCYEEMAKALGKNPEEKKRICFDFGDPKYVEAYFKYTHHQNEEDGVDFWWTDGFPKNSGSMLKSDNPWLLNHFHYIDSCKNNKRGMIFSRYAGIGSQRYPIGFSGDTYATWDTLDFMPYFTATASNVGFGWWGHDIGGFAGGDRDEELMARWTQFGAFSPITRLHSCNNPFMSKEPWNYSDLTHNVMAKFMKLRHRMIPYIYTMNHTAFADNLPLIRPMYYYHPNGRALQNRNEYFFGSEMLISPITSHSDSASLMGQSRTYLPEGLWFDFFNDRKYIGDRIYTCFRTLEEMPVFVKAGGIIPLSNDGGNSIANPENLEVLIYPGADNTFELYEDDGKTNDYRKGIGCNTKFQYKWSKKPEFIIHKPDGTVSLIPDKRNYKLVFKCINDCNDISVTVDGNKAAFEKHYENGAIIICADNVNGELKVVFESSVSIKENNTEKELFDLLMKTQISHSSKSATYNEFKKAKTFAEQITVINAFCCDENVRNAIMELITAGGE